MTEDKRMLKVSPNNDWCVDETWFEILDTVDDKILAVVPDYEIASRIADMLCGAWLCGRLYEGRDDDA